MFFSEVYGVYFNAMAEILRCAADHPIDMAEMRKIIAGHAFGESGVFIEQCIKDEKWQLMTADGRTNIQHATTMPLTLLEKRWLRAIQSDPRINLFDVVMPDLSDIEPLFYPDDILIFDKYSDGDPYEDEDYIRHFRMVLKAVREKRPLKICTLSRKGTVTKSVFLPAVIEYSEKDDKFRAVGTGKHGNTVNIARILSCKLTDEQPPDIKNSHTARTVEFDLTNERNALERVMMHFAHFEKQAVKTGDKTYHVSLCYDKDDETEMVIRLLSFGPMVRVTAPESFVALIKQRLIRQKRCAESNVHY